jgi:hypothetical protein
LFAELLDVDGDEVENVDDISSRDSDVDVRDDDRVQRLR